jgi:hypothetical protein
VSLRCFEWAELGWEGLNFCARGPGEIRSMLWGCGGIEGFRPYLIDGNERARAIS